jgi:hypothetical protein
VGADLGIPTQVLNDEPWTYPCRASVAWRLLIAFYTEAGGTPRTPAPAAPRTAAVHDTRWVPARRIIARRTSRPAVVAAGQ